MTARLATHPDAANFTSAILDQLVAARVDVEFVGSEPGESGQASDPLRSVRESTIDLALVGISALRGSAADDLTTVAVLPRTDVRDVLVDLTGRFVQLAGLPAGSRVGVVGQRRLAYLAAHRPEVEGVVLDSAEMTDLISGRDRADAGVGEVGTNGPDVSAIVVSAPDARLGGLADSTVEVLDPKSWLPEPGQGALALIARHPIAEATALDHLPTRTALRAELALLDALEADDDAPLGCLAQPSGRWIRLWAAAASPDGNRLVRSDMTGPLDEPELLGASVARQLTERGVGLVLEPAS